MTTPRSSRWPRWIAGVGTASLVAAAALTGTVAFAPGAQAAACAGDEGVTVVVDFGSLGGVQTRCAVGDPRSGVAALQIAGFSVDGTQQYGLAFVCRIDGLPKPEQEPCTRTPSPQQYWAYSHAEPGGSWNYSSSGASSRDPAPGSVEGWRFGSGGSPSVPPPGAPEPEPEPEDDPAPPPAAGSTGGSSSGGSEGGSSSSGGSEGGSRSSGGSSGSGSSSEPGGDAPTDAEAGTGTGAPEAPAATDADSEAAGAPSSPSATTPSETAATGTPSTSTGDPGPSASSTPEDLDAARTSSGPDEGGSAAGVVVAAVALLAIAGAGAWQVVSRRRARAGDVGD